jgi:hypothetical protein
MSNQPDIDAKFILMDQDEPESHIIASHAEDMYRPTLVIGLGGTGTLVLKRLKRLIREKFDDNRSELFQLLALDTEMQSLDYYQRLEVREFMNLAETTILGDDIVESMMNSQTEQIYKGLRAWWPIQSNGHSPFFPGDIVSGAKATRCVGRLALWYRGMEVYRAIEQRLNSALLIRGLRRVDIPATGNSAKVFIVCSLAGGTGSGMYIDIAYMLRHILNKMGMTSFMTGLLLADASPFASIIQEEGLVRRMEANTYAALCELDWFMGGYRGASQNGEASNTRYNLQYLGHLRVQSPSKPFDVCYLLTGMNEHGRRLRHLDDLTEMMAQEIFLEIATPLGRTGRSVLDNVERLSYYSQYGPRPLAYSSFAVSSLDLTPKLVVQQCTLSLAKYMLERLIKFDREGEARLSVQVQEQLGDLPLHTDGAAEVLHRQMENDTNSRMPDLAFSAGISDGQYQIEAPRLLKDLVFLLEEQIRPAYRNAEPVLAERYRAHLDAIMRTLLSTTDLSLAQISTIVESWLSGVTSSRIEMEDEAKAARGAAETAKSHVDSVWNNLQRASAGSERRLLFPARKHDHIVAASQEYLSGLERWTSCNLDEYQWQTLTGVFGHIERHLRKYRDHMLRLSERLAPTYERILERQRVVRSKLEEGSNKYQLEFEALDAADVDKLADDLLRQVDRELLAQAVLEEMTLIDTAQGRDELRGRRIIECLAKGVRAWLHSSNLFDILSRIHENSDAGVERQLKRLVEYAAPFWRLTLTNCPEAAEWSVISLVGYAGASKAASGSYIEKTMQKVIDRCTTVDIAEPNRIVFLNTKHGVPAFALAATTELMRRAYYEYKNGWLNNQPGIRPVHVSQEWMGLNDFNPMPWSEQK